MEQDRRGELLHRDPEDLGREYVERLNTFLESTGEEGQYIAIDSDSFASIFGQTIITLLKEKRSIQFQPVMLATSLRLYDDLKTKKEKWPSSYFVEESVTLEMLGDISRFILKQHPDVKEKWLSMDFASPQ